MDSKTGVRLFAAVAPPAGPVRWCFCQRNYAGVEARNSLKELHLSQLWEKALLQVCLECKFSHLSVRAGFTVSDVFPSWGSVLAGSMSRGNPWQQKNRPQRGKAVFPVSLIWRRRAEGYDGRIEDLISRGRKCRKTNNNDLGRGMDLWKEDLTWWSSGSDKH